MAHTWKHKQDQKALEKFPQVKKRMKKDKRRKSFIDLGELADEGYDIEQLFKGTSLAELEKRLSKKKF